MTETPSSSSKGFIQNLGNVATTPSTSGLADEPKKHSSSPAAEPAPIHYGKRRASRDLNSSPTKQMRKASQTLPENPPCPRNRIEEYTTILLAESIKFAENYIKKNDIRKISPIAMEIVKQ